MASVTFRNVTKKFGDFTALHNLNLEIEDKEFLVLVGPSGCGKTTALRCLAGLEDISSGEVEIGGLVVNDVAPKDRDISMVFQSYALYPHMTVFDNMAFGLKLRGFKKPDIIKRVDIAAKILEISHLLKRKPRELSGGQRQRVALGRAIVREPKVFLFDEPLSNLDAKLRGQTRAEISKLHQRLNTTFIYVTHDQMEAMTMATRIAVMNKGLLQQLDTPQNLYDHPNNLFVAGFIGTPSMNFFNVILKKEGDDLFIENPGFKLKVPGKHPKKTEFEKHVGHEVIFGIRPEDIHDPHFTPPGIDTAPVKAKVDITELMGNEIFLHLISEGPTYVARVDPRTPFRIGEDVEVAFNMDNFHLFNPKADKDNPPVI